MNLFELIIYLALSAVLTTSIFLAYAQLAELQRSLNQQIDTSHAALIKNI